MTAPVWSRRKFLAAVGAVGTGLAVAGVSTVETRAAPTPRPVVRSYASRPDLRPANLRILARADGRAAGSLLITPNGGSSAGGLMIVGDDGHLVWFKPVQGATGLDLKVQQHAGEPVLTWWEGTVVGGHGQGEHVIADASYAELQRVHAQGGYQADLHDFQLTDRGTALLLAYQPMPADLTSVGGTAAGVLLDAVVQEIDLSDGQLVFEWRGVDHVALDETHSPLPSDPTQAFDFLHLNSVGVDHDGNLLVSARNTWTIYKIERSSGQVLWRLGGKKNDFAMSDGAAFAWQHDARRQADGSLTLFDDGADPPVESQSRGLVLTVDEPTMTTSVARQFTHPDHVLTGSQGNLQVLTDSALVGWGAQPRLTEFSTDGRVLLDATLPDGSSSYRAFRLPWTAKPTDQPTASVERSSGAIVTHVSWNGATGVQSWRVLAGTAPSALRPVTTRPRTGFETSISLDPIGPQLVIEALDAAGFVLGATAPLTS